MTKMLSSSVSVPPFKSRPSLLTFLKSEFIFKNFKIQLNYVADERWFGHWDAHAQFKELSKRRLLRPITDRTEPVWALTVAVTVQFWQESDLLSMMHEVKAFWKIVIYIYGFCIHFSKVVAVCFFLVNLYKRKKGQITYFNFDVTLK